MSSTSDTPKLGIKERGGSQLHPSEGSGLGDTFETSKIKGPGLESVYLSALPVKTPVKTPPKTKRGSAKDSPKSLSSEETQTSTATDATTACSLGSVAELPTFAHDDEYNRDGLPGNIKTTYYVKEADLVKDLEKFGLLDDYKHIALTEVHCGRAYRLEMPTDFHEQTCRGLGAQISTKCGSGLLWMTNSQIHFSDGSTRFPDLAIFGETRVDVDKTTGLKDPKREECKELGCNSYVNPHVLIEFSWTHEMKVEVPKFVKQMEEHPQELGRINVGFLIKTIPTNSSKDYPKFGDLSNPICGFDVYEFCGERCEIVNGEPTSKYRVGVNEETYFEIRDEDLGRNGEKSYRFPLGYIRERLESLEVKFEEKQKK